MTVDDGSMEWCDRNTMHAEVTSTYTVQSLESDEEKGQSCGTESRI